MNRLWLLASSSIPVQFFICNLAVYLAVNHARGSKSFVPTAIDIPACCFWNSLIAGGVILYRILTFLNFGETSTECDMNVFKKVCRIFLMKLPLLGVILKSTPKGVNVCAAMFALFVVSKGLSIQGLNYIEKISSISGPKRWKYYIRPLGHLLFMMSGIMLIYDLSYVAAEQGADVILRPWRSFHTMLLFDVRFLCLDFMHSVTVFTMNFLDCVGVIPSWINVTIIIFVVQSITGLVKSSCLLVFLVQLFFLDSLDSFALKDILVLIFSFGQLGVLLWWVLNTSRYVETRFQVNALFPAVTRDLSSEVCPICIHPFSVTARQLPCGHLLHLDCAFELVWKKTEVDRGPSGDDATNTEQHAHPVYAPSVRRPLGGKSGTSHNATTTMPRLSYPLHYIRCPLCRKRVCLESGYLVEDVRISPIKSTDGEAENK